MAEEIKDEELPYEFDLLYDIKTLAELRQKYIWAVQELEGLNELIKTYNIKISPNAVNDG